MKGKSNFKKKLKQISINTKKVDNPYYDNIPSGEKFIEDFNKAIQEVIDNNNSDNYYKETRYSDGSILIESKHNGRSLNLMVEV